MSFQLDLVHFLRIVKSPIELFHKTFGLVQINLYEAKRLVKPPLYVASCSQEIG